jgi:hypothetical protein
MMIRLDKYRESGGYQSGFKYYDDMLLAVRLCELGDVAYIDKHLYTARQHSKNEHVEPDVRVVRKEVLPIIEIAFNGALSARLPDAASMYRRIVKRALVHHAIFHVFSGRPGQGWRLYWESVKCKPLDTVFQRSTLTLVARTVLGERIYNKGIRAVKRVLARSELVRDARS